jgi:hypothetical protein
MRGRLRTAQPDIDLLKGRESKNESRAGASGRSGCLERADLAPRVRTPAEQRRFSTFDALTVKEIPMRTVAAGAVLALLVWGVWNAAATAQKGRPAHEPGLELDLKQLTLQDVMDSAGSWQFEGGQVVHQRKHVANYATVRRVVNKGTTEQNTGMVTTTIFFLGKQPPENMTLQGAHDYNSGNETGSVSAASGQHAAYIGKAFSNNKSVMISIR